MSPEQAKGRAVDKRTDIWAFGAVLFEMLTGTRAFGKGDVTETLARVIEREPDFGALPAGTPEPIRRVLRRSFAKERKQRLPDIAAARLDLDDVMTGSSAEVIVPPAGQPATRRHVIPWALGMLVVGGLIAGLAVWSLTRPIAPLVSQFTFLHPSSNLSTLDVLSPDGRTIVFANSLNGPLPPRVRRLDEREAIPLRGAEGLTPLGFSPDGEWVLVFDYPLLKKIPVAGGLAITIAEDFTRGAAWGPGDIIVSGSEDGTLDRVSGRGRPSAADRACRRRERAILRTEHPPEWPSGPLLHL